MLTSADHISLQQQLVNCDSKMFYNIGFRQLLQQSATVKTFMFKTYAQMPIMNWLVEHLGYNLKSCKLFCKCLRVQTTLAYNSH